MKFLLAIGAAFALYDVNTKPMEPAFNEWMCVQSLISTSEVVIDDKSVKVNNILLNQSDDLIKGNILRVSASATNLGNRSAQISLEVMGFLPETDQGSFAFAVSATPIFGFVSAGKTEQFQNNIIYDGFDQSQSGCFRVRLRYAE